MPLMAIMKFGYNSDLISHIQFRSPQFTEHMKGLTILTLGDERH